MALEGVLEGARGRIPQAHGIVPAAAGQGAAVGAEGHAQDRIRVACKQGQDRVRTGIVEPDANAAPHGQAGAVRGILHSANPAPTQTGSGTRRQVLEPGCRGHTGRCQDHEQERHHGQQPGRAFH